MITVSSRSAARNASTTEGTGFEHVAHIRTFVTDLGDLPAYGAVRRELLPTPPPASTTVEVSRLFRAGALLEVEVTAAVPRQHEVTAAAPRQQVEATAAAPRQR